MTDRNTSSIPQTPSPNDNITDTNDSKHGNANDNDNGLYRWDSAHLLTAVQSLNAHWYEANNATTNVATNAITTDTVPNLSATRITTDTRKIQAGDIFLALIGDNFDGHNFLAIAQQKGAVAVIVSTPDASLDLPQLIVDDTRLALGQLASYRRHQHPNLKVIAITGSSGKTSVKEMLRSIFAPIAPTLVTRGNLNNDLGVPMMLLELQDRHRYAILELGANHVGEIAYTTDIVRPDVACILNIGTAHLGEFGGRDNIAKTKAEIYQTLNDINTHNGTAVIPLDDDYTAMLYTQALHYTANIIGFGWQASQDDTYKDSDLLAHLYATDINSNAVQNTFNLHIKNNPTNHAGAQSAHIHLPLAGQHNISNALAAASCAYALGIALEDIAIGLRQAVPAKGRLEWLDFAPHRIIDDTYNANPHSVRVAVDVLTAQPNYKILVLGDIGELGDDAVREHQGLGQYIAHRAIDSLFCVGKYAINTVHSAQDASMSQAYAFANKDELLTQLRQCIAAQKDEGNTVTLLFKGSRSMTMETLIIDLMTA